MKAFPDYTDDVTILEMRPLSHGGEFISDLWTAIEHALVDGAEDGPGRAPLSDEADRLTAAKVALQEWFLSSRDLTREHVRHEYAIADDVTKAGIRSAFKWACPHYAPDGKDRNDSDEAWGLYRHHVVEPLEALANLHGQLIVKHEQTARDLDDARRTIASRELTIDELSAARDQLAAKLTGGGSCEHCPDLKPGASWCPACGREAIPNDAPTVRAVIPPADIDRPERASDIYS